MTDPEAENEWREGWRIVLGCALASGSGIVLLFFTFNLFVLPLAAKLGVTRGEIGTIQALIVTGALGAPIIARRFPIVQYGTVYGALNGISWIGNGIGIAGVGLLHDRMGNYDLGQLIGMAALAAGAVLVGFVRLPAAAPRIAL